MVDDSGVGINPDCEGAIDPPLRIVTADKFLEKFKDPGRLPEPGEVLEPVREEEWNEEEEPE